MKACTHAARIPYVQCSIMAARMRASSAPCAAGRDSIHKVCARGYSECVLAGRIRRECCICILEVCEYIN